MAHDLTIRYDTIQYKMERNRKADIPGVFALRVSPPIGLVKYVNIPKPAAMHRRNTNTNGDSPKSLPILLSIEANFNLPTPTDQDPPI